MKSVLITGAGSGIGNAVAKLFSENGYLVYAIDITEIRNQQMISFVADITKKEQLSRVQQYFQQNHIQIDFILNFAGIHKMGSFLETDIQKIQQVMNINVLGTILVNQMFYPFLKEKGKILITTSEVAGMDPMPFNGIYHMSKSALDCYSQSLRQELNLKGQKVITLRPGAVKTKLSDNSLPDTKQLCDETILFREESQYFLQLIQKFIGTPMPAEKLAKFVFKIVNKKNPKYIYHKHVNVGLKLLSILPKKMQCWIIKKLLQRKKRSK